MGNGISATLDRFVASSASQTIHESQYAPSGRQIAEQRQFDRLPCDREHFRSRRKSTRPVCQVSNDIRSQGTSHRTVFASAP